MTCAVRGAVAADGPFVLTKKMGPPPLPKEFAPQPSTQCQHYTSYVKVSQESTPEAFLSMQADVRGAGSFVVMLLQVKSDAASYPPVNE